MTSLLESFHLCQTCLERGRQRVGTHLVGSGLMCDSCYNGEGDPHELSGDNAGDQRAVWRHRKWYENNRDRAIRKAKEYRMKHPERVKAVKMKFAEKLMEVNQ